MVSDNSSKNIKVLITMNKTTTKTGKTVLSIFLEIKINLWVISTIRKIKRYMRPEAFEGEKVPPEFSISRASTPTEKQ